MQLFVLCCGGIIPAYTMNCYVILTCKYTKLTYKSIKKLTCFQTYCILLLSGEKELETRQCQPWKNQLGFVKIDISWTGLKSH